MKVPAKKAAKAPAKRAGATRSAPKKAVVKNAGVKKQGAKKPVPPPMPPLVLTPPTPESQAAVLDRLFDVITARRTADVTRSHSARLLSRGMAKVAQKFGEEAVECLIEAVTGNTEALVAESADVLYHLLVMWVGAGVQPNQVWAELARREGISGIAEKAARARPLGTTKIP